jgi:hypothetical protein
MRRAARRSSGQRIGGVRRDCIGAPSASRRRLGATTSTRGYCFRPDPVVCCAGSARLLLFSRRHAPDDPNGDEGVARPSRRLDDRVRREPVVGVASAGVIQTSPMRSPALRACRRQSDHPSEAVVLPPHASRAPGAVWRAQNAPRLASSASCSALMTSRRGGANASRRSQSDTTEGNIAGGVIASRRWAPRGRRTRACVRSPHAENREGPRSPARRDGGAGRAGKAKAVIP